MNTAGHAYDFEKDGIYYNITSLQNLTVEVTSGDNRYIGDFVIPEEVFYSERLFMVTKIGDKAFSHSDVTKIIIPNSITTIGVYAFEYCSALHELSIPSSVSNIGSGCFTGCRGLNNLRIEDGDKGLSLGYKEYQVNNYSTFLDCPLVYVYIGRNCTGSSGDYHATFYNQRNLKTIEIGGNVTYIGGFANCYGLEEIDIPGNVNSISSNAFNGCKNLQNTIIHEGVQHIGSSAFNGCTSINTITFPSTIIGIGNGSFAGCTSINNIYSKIIEPFDISQTAFAGITYLNSTLYVPTGTKNLYQERRGWKDFVSIVETDDFEDIPVIPEKPKCASPTISYVNWNIKFECETEGAQIVSEVKPTDLKNTTEVEVSLTPTYIITAYAIAEGYQKSDMVTATISWRKGRPVIIQGFSNVNLEESTANCDVNGDCTVDVADIATIISNMAAHTRKNEVMEE